jgi:SAM-dependent MidA family methyltransferase
LKAQTENAALVELVRNEIRNYGPQPFAWFMHQALYHPEHGYYSSGRCAIGRNGDYFTNVSVGPLFGQLLCAQFVEIWERLGKINNFVIVEQGAHDGQFARDVLEFAQTHAPEFFAALRYQIVEPFRVLQQRQQQMVQTFRHKVDWSGSLQPFVGVHFSNELLDAMPVRLISGGREKCVALDGDRFVFVDRLLHDDRTFNETALNWICEVARNLQSGYVITIDYGRLGDDTETTVQVRAQHQHLDSPFEQIGHADITVHVHWASIVDRALANGLRLVGFADQYHFLTGLISEFELRDSPKSKRELQTLLHPEMLGRAFQVLALGKNVDIGERPLAGFKFARKPHVALNIG